MVTASAAIFTKKPSGVSGRICVSASFGFSTRDRSMFAARFTFSRSAVEFTSRGGGPRGSVGSRERMANRSPNRAAVSQRMSYSLLPRRRCSTGVFSKGLYFLHASDYVTHLSGLPGIFRGRSCLLVKLWHRDACEAFVGHNVWEEMITIFRAKPCA